MVPKPSHTNTVCLILVRRRFSASLHRATPMRKGETARAPCRTARETLRSGDFRYLEECDVAETARRTGWTKSMVKVQTWRARKKLEKLFTEAEKENII